MLHDQGAAGRVHRGDAYLSENSPGDARLGLSGVCGFGPPAARRRTKSGLEPGERFANSMGTLGSCIDTSCSVHLSMTVPLRPEATKSLSAAQVFALR